MPLLDVTLPRATPAVKRALISNLTDAAVAAGLERDIFRVVIREYDPGDAGTAGKRWDGDGLPVLHLVLYCPRQPLSRKKSLIENLSRAFMETVGRDDWWPIIHILEYPYDNLGIHGQISWEAHPELKSRKFYFDLPED
jgi:phenylpyruvate tautomerase PptA (4-oxalocrotonate tautomerase family)